MRQPVREISLRFGVEVSAEEFRRKAGTHLAAVLAKSGWKLKQQADDLFMWERRFWPRWGQFAFVCAVLVGPGFIFQDLPSDNGTFWLALLVWVGLMVGCGLIRQVGTLTMSVEARQSGAVVEFAGAADARTARALDELADGMPSAESVGEPVRTPGPSIAAPSGSLDVPALRELAALRDRGALTDAEFESAKARVLNGAPANLSTAPPPRP